MANLWRLRGRLLIASVGVIRSCGGCTACLLIMIRGPNFSQLLLIILSSAAMVCSCAVEAWLISNVNFFIYPLLLALALSCRPEPVDTLASLITGKISNEVRSHYIPEPGDCQLLNFFLVLYWAGPPAWGLTHLFYFFSGQARWGRRALF